MNVEWHMSTWSPRPCSKIKHILLEDHFKIEQRTKFHSLQFYIDGFCMRILFCLKKAFWKLLKFWIVFFLEQKGFYCDSDYDFGFDCLENVSPWEWHLPCRSARDLGRKRVCRNRAAPDPVFRGRSPLSEKRGDPPAPGSKHPALMRS